MAAVDFIAKALLQKTFAPAVSTGGRAFLSSIVL
jgi:hypothetical protein